MKVSFVERDYVFNALRAVTVDDSGHALPLYVLKAAVSRWGRSQGFTHSPHVSVIAAVVESAGYDVREGRTTPIVRGIDLHPAWRNS
ncbi:hypothetical protein [Streptomyces lycii]|uniref:Uncharacterized protein n=1 Tax=Streptomyces lycii TaxID=2654337 RepID=A0ABQ7FQK7_9ACTN|nr:hypothetical protein [Streptomyces lycii]KAF4410913.1 hypothetical protein GCU69_01450 [Streptomyces lycii]